MTISMASSHTLTDAQKRMIRKLWCYALPTSLLGATLMCLSLTQIDSLPHRAYAGLSAFFGIILLLVGIVGMMVSYMLRGEIGTVQ